MSTESGVRQAGELRSARIESLRAVAALAVLVSHSLILGGGYSQRLLPKIVLGGSLGVYLFFALTGYLLFLPFARRYFAGGRPIDLGRYAKNRALRILPLYYFVVVVLLIVHEHGGSAAQWLRFGTFTESFFRDTVSTVDGPMWSLVVEVQFYALLPLLAWGIALVARGHRGRAAAVIAGLGAVSAAIWWRKMHTPYGNDTRWLYSLPTTFLNFTPGMLLALLRLELSDRGRRLPSSTTLIAAGVACWMLAAVDQGIGRPVSALAAFLVVGAVVLPCRDGLPARLLDTRALVVVGVASYSLYLWHYPIVASLARHGHLGFAALLPVALVVCVVVALVSYETVERPFLRLRRRWGSTLPRAEAEPEPKPEQGPADAPLPAAAAAAPAADR